MPPLLTMVPLSIAAHCSMTSPPELMMVPFAVPLGRPQLAAVEMTVLFIPRQLPAAVAAMLAYPPLLMTVPLAVPVDLHFALVVDDGAVGHAAAIHQYHRRLGH